MKSLMATTVAIFGLVGTTAFAQYTGPAGGTKGSAGGYVETTVSEIKANPKDDANVILEGNLIEKTGDETYTFRDKTGTISVEIDDDDFPNQPVDENTVVRIEGEVDTHLVKDVDIDAERVTIIQ